MKPRRPRRLDALVLLSLALRVDVQGYQKTVYWAMKKHGREERTVKRWIEEGRRIEAQLRPLGYFNNRPLAFG